MVNALDPGQWESNRDLSKANAERWKNSMKVEETAKRLLEIANTTEAEPNGGIDVG